MTNEFASERAAVKWLRDNLGMYWEENCEEGRYAACVPPKNDKDDPIFAYGDTVAVTVQRLAEAVNG